MRRALQIGGLAALGAAVGAVLSSARLAADRGSSGWMLPGPTKKGAKHDHGKGNGRERDGRDWRPRYVVKGLRP